MLLDIMGHHGRRNIQQLARRNPKIAAIAKLAAKFASMWTASRRKVESLGAISCQPSELSKANDKVGRRLPMRVSMVGREPAYRADVVA